MVAISLYRGNMHRAPPDVPRRWLNPKPQISLKAFRKLLLRRSKALSVLPSTSSGTVVVSSGTGNPNSSPRSDVRVEDATNCDANHPPPLDQVASLIDAATLQKEDQKVGDVSPQGNNKLDPVDDEKEKRKKEVEDKLHILNEKKHNLVKALKQILNAEEELKSRSSIQGGRPPLPLQADGSNDSGSMTRHATPRPGSEANVTVDVEGVEGDHALNQNPRQLLRLNSTSPSAESALKRPPSFQHDGVSHAPRAAIVAAASPSYLAPTVNPVHPSTLPTVSVTGTNYIASSPSPAASVGTSGFREARQPSPWN